MFAAGSLAAGTSRCNGTVASGEPIEHTRDAVKDTTGNQQHPDTAGRFDRELIMGNVE